MYIYVYEEKKYIYIQVQWYLAKSLNCTLLLHKIFFLSLKKGKRILLYRLLPAAGLPPALLLKMLEALSDQFPIRIRILLN